MMHTNCSHHFAASVGALLFVFVVAAFGSACAQEVDADTGKAAAIHPQLAQELSAVDGPVSFLIILDEQAELAGEPSQRGRIDAASRLSERKPIGRG